MAHDTIRDTTTSSSPSQVSIKADKTLSVFANFASRSSIEVPDNNDVSHSDDIKENKVNINGGSLQIAEIEDENSHNNDKMSIFREIDDIHDVDFFDFGDSQSQTISLKHNVNLHSSVAKIKPSISRLDKTDVLPVLDFVANLSNISQVCNNFSLHDPFLHLLKASKTSNIFDTMFAIANQGSKYRHKKSMSLSKRGKNIAEAIWNAFRRIASSFDIYTDCYLLYLVHLYTNPSQSELLPFGVILCISIICPYIASYSCGIKLMAMNNLYKKYVGLQKLLLYVGLSPIGVSYFILLDLVDIIFSCYKLIAILLFGKTEIEMKLLEETVANQLGMTRMEYEGIKRQRGVIMIMFETIPQVMIQLMLLFGAFGAINSVVLDEAGINSSSVYPSVFSAVLNLMFQIMRLKLEAKAVGESFQQYCLECFMARVSWIPFKNQIESYLAGNFDSKWIVDHVSNNNSDTFKICYDIKYQLPLLKDKLDKAYKPKVSFDFSSSTIHQLIATMELASAARNFMDNKNKNNGNNNNTIIVQTGMSPRRKDIGIGYGRADLAVPEKLEIDFGKSLRLINFSDLMNILEACSNHNILISGIDSNKLYGLISRSVDISSNSGNHVTIGKNKSGKPFSSSLYSMCLKNVLSTDKGTDELTLVALECMIWKGFDLNGIDNTNGETILFDLIRANDIGALSLVLEKYVKEKRNRLLMDYHNNDGMSPLCVAIRDFIKRKNSNNNNNNNNNNNSDNNQGVKHIYQMLIDNEIENACLNFPAFNFDVSHGIQSILGYVLYRKEWKLCQELFKKGAVLDSREGFILTKSYVITAYDSKNRYQHLNIVDEIARASCHDCLPHLSGLNGNNPVHEFIIFMQNHQNFGLENHKTALGKLIELCPEWVLAQNNENKTPFEMVLELLYTKRTRSKDYHINLKYISLLDAMMNHLSRASKIIFEILTKYRLNEYKTCIFHLKMVIVLDGMKTIKNNSVSKKMHDSVTAGLVKQFGNIIGNDSSGIKWIDVIQEAMKKTKRYLSVSSIKQFIVANVGFEFEPESKQDAISGLQHSFWAKVWKETVNAEDDASETESDIKSKNELNDEVDNKLEDKPSNVVDSTESQLQVDQESKQLEDIEEEEKDPITWFEWVYVFGVESLSCADLITDGVILSEFANGHMWWTTFSILFMISPYLVSYTAMGTLLQRKFESNILSVVAMTPLCTIYFLLLDVIFIIYAIIHSLVFLVSCSRANIGNWMEDKLFHKYLRVGRMELIGYRRLRTFSQLIFETAPSVALQIYILIKLGTNDNDLNVSYENLVYSIVFAVLHTVLEGSILYLDSRAGHLSIAEYGIICLNARLSWVPFTNILSLKSTATTKGFETNVNKDNQTRLSEFPSLNFEEITSNLRSMKYKLDFEFGKDSWQVLIKYINDIDAYCPNFIQKSKQVGANAMTMDTNITRLLIPLFSESVNSHGMWFDCRSDVLSHNNKLNVVPHIFEIKFGKNCCRNLDLFDLRDLLRVGSNRLLIDFGDINWKRLVKMTKRVRSNTVDIKYVLSDIIKYLLKMGDFKATIQLFEATALAKGITSTNINNTFNLLKSEILLNCRYNMLALKRCYDIGIMFGMSCEESTQLYSIVYQLVQMLLQENDSDFMNKSMPLEDGAKFYIAMLFLWYSQGTIKNHHCYECGRDWIDHIISLKSHFTNGIENDNNDINGISNDSSLSNTSVISVTIETADNDSVRQQINALIDFYLHPTITLEVGKNDSNNTTKTMDIPVSTVCFLATKELNQLIGNHLFSKAYTYWFTATTAAIEQNTNGNSKGRDLDIEKYEIIFKRNDCTLLRNESKKLSDITNVDDDLEHLNVMSRMASIVDKRLLDGSSSTFLGKFGEIQTEKTQLKRDGADAVFTIDFSSFIHVCTRYDIKNRILEDYGRYITLLTLCFCIGFVLLCSFKINIDRQVIKMVVV